MGKCLRPECGRFIGGGGGQRLRLLLKLFLSPVKDPAAGISEGAHLVRANSVGCPSRARSGPATHEGALLARQGCAGH